MEVQSSPEQEAQPVPIGTSAGNDAGFCLEKNTHEPINADQPVSLALHKLMEGVKIAPQIESNLWKLFRVKHSRRRFCWSMITDLFERH